MRNDRSHPGLLQHDLRKPDAVRVATLAPRQRARMRVVPRQQMLTKLSRQWPQDRCLRQSQCHKWISYPHRTVHASVLKIFGENFWEAIMVGVSPEVSIEPGEMVGRHAAQRCAKNVLVRIKH